MCFCAAVGDDMWRGAFAASCLSGILWPVYNWWVEWIRDEFVTVSQPDGDRQSSSLALLIWLMMTMIVMMMPVFLPQLCPGLCPGHASPLSSILYLFWMATQRQRNVPEKKRQGEETEMRGGDGVWGRRRPQEWKTDKRRTEDRSGGGDGNSQRVGKNTWKEKMTCRSDLEGGAIYQPINWPIKIFSSTVYFFTCKHSIFSLLSVLS